MDFLKKHSNEEPVPADRAEDVKAEAPEAKMPCAKAIGLAEKWDIPPSEAGAVLDRLEIRLTHCQCGLFGYPPPEKKRIKPLEKMHSDLEQEIRNAVIDNAVPCVDVWRIADRLGISKLTAACGCETMKIAIKPCQLGAF